MSAPSVCHIATTATGHSAGTTSVHFASKTSGFSSGPVSSTVYCPPLYSRISCSNRMLLMACLIMLCVRSSCFRRDIAMYSPKLSHSSFFRDSSDFFNSFRVSTSLSSRESWSVGSFRFMGCASLALVYGLGRPRLLGCAGGEGGEGAEAGEGGVCSCTAVSLYVSDVLGSSLIMTCSCSSIGSSSSSSPAASASASSSSLLSDDSPDFDSGFEEACER
uniref:SFRICE_008633 n=1 Tax=Spodoptera frugiperda TaxID=7108 RepID=A0A2H1VGA2_SPOFR